MSERRLLLAVLQSAKAQLAISDAAWRELIARETGQRSCAAASDAALLRLLRRLELLGFSSERRVSSLTQPPSTRGAAEDATGIFGSNVRGTFDRRHASPSRGEGKKEGRPLIAQHSLIPSPLEGEGKGGGSATARKPQARLVWALWAELGRLGALRNNSRTACRAFCAATAKIRAATDPDFMTAAQLDPVIFVLKAWLARAKQTRRAAGPAPS